MFASVVTTNVSLVGEVSVSILFKLGLRRKLLMTSLMIENRLKLDDYSSFFPDDQNCIQENLMLFTSVQFTDGMRLENVMGPL